MKIRSVEELGEAIRTRRKELHYTQAFLAEFTGFSVSFISDVERGKATGGDRKDITASDDIGIGSVGGKESMSCGN